ncbi:MAG: hypothetical protein HY711_06080 [Candidatus Melainabacteria bacterium]|nr:hypothetical protein [Candidatus Melainabacteria bacterium]
MNRIIVLLGTVLMFTAWLDCDQAWAAGCKQWYGYLIDRQCAESVEKDTKPKAFVLHHTKDCALMSNCQAKGYALFVDGKWYDLDKRGNELAIQVLQGSRKEHGFYVQVTAVLQGKMLKVNSLQESKEPTINSVEKERNGTD